MARTSSPWNSTPKNTAEEPAMRCNRPPWLSIRACAAAVGTGLVLLAVLAAGSRSARAEATPVLCIPAAGQPLDLAIALPRGVKADSAAAWQLVEDGRPPVVVPVELTASTSADGAVADKQGRLIARIPPRSGATGVRLFCLEPAHAAQVPAKGRFELKPLDDKSLAMQDAGKPVLVYNFGTVTRDWVPPKDNRRSRGCYVHPLYGLSGEVLTDTAPKDHYHHHGIFWAWPHVTIGGTQYDLWTYKDIQQKFVRWLARDAGPLAATIGVENGWFVGPRQVMTERVWLRAYSIDGDHRALDVDLYFIPTDRPVTLRGAEGKSYGGINLRFAPRTDTLITVDRGVTKDDLPDTPLAWADLTGKFAKAAGPSGAALFVDPRHPNYPPTWLTRHYGILCVGWPGVKEQTLPAGKAVHLSYRIWIHRAAVSVADLKRAYEVYACESGVAANQVAWK
jgi:hypothetical protein